MRLTKIQQQLREVMSDTSELHYCAGWMEGTEYRLWQFVIDPADDGKWGFYALEPERRDQLRELAAKAGGWVIFQDDRRAPRDREGNSFVLMKDWVAMFEAWKAIY
jgi:hypothetical protein